MRSFFTIIIFFLSIGTSFSQDDSKLFINKSYTEKWLAEKHIPALGIGYIKDGKIKEVSVYGKNDKGRKLPKNTIFSVASLTKPITAFVALELVNEGKWDLDIPITKYWADPDVRSDPRCYELTMRNILCHQSGFPNWRKDMPDGKLAFEFAPGTKFQYSGEGYEYLRHMLEKRFGRTLPQLAEQLLFKPLGMNDTHFYWDSAVAESRFAKCYKSDGAIYPLVKNTTENAADGLLTTVEDYSKFMVYIMNGAGFNAGLFSDMISRQVKVKPRKSFGLGWWLDEDVAASEDALVHGGDDEGVHTLAIILPKEKEGLLIFTNCDNGTDIFAPIIRHYLGKAGEEIINIETK